MGKAKFDDDSDDYDIEEPPLKKRKSGGRNRLRENEENDHRGKRSSVRSHRKKTHKDEMLDDH